VTKTYLNVNPAAGLQGDGRNREQRPDEAREKFTSDDLARIFGASWFKTGRPKLTQNGTSTKHFRPVHYWLPLLALHTGGRANELGQLYVSDICNRGGSSPYVAFRLVHPDQIDADEGDSLPDKSLKTVNSKRNVPIHEELTRLGFLEYVDALETAGFTRVFPELSFDKTKGYGLAARKWFNEHYLGRTLKIERNGKKTLHSLRHNFSTAAHESGIVGRMHKQLMGHERGESLAEVRYTKDGEPDEVKPLIDQMKFDLPPIAPLDIQVALRAISHALAAKKNKKPGD
jgi:integrase